MSVGGALFKTKARSGTKRFILGEASPLPKTRLPTRGDVFNYLKFLHQERNGFSTAHKTAADSVFHKICTAVREMWLNEDIPIHDIKNMKGA